MSAGNYDQLEDQNICSTEPKFLKVSLYLSHNTRKPVFGICDKVRLKPVCSADETSKGLEIFAIASRSILLSRQRTTKALIRLRACAG